MLKQWEKVYGRTDDDRLRVVRQTSDGGYLLGGEATAGVSGNKTSTGGGYWIIKIDANGAKQWEQNYGGPSGGYDLFDAQQTTDGGYILGGTAPTGVDGYKTSTKSRR